MDRIKLEPGWLRESILEAGRKLEQLKRLTYQDVPAKEWETNEVMKING